MYKRKLAHIQWEYCSGEECSGSIGETLKSLRGIKIIPGISLYVHGFRLVDILQSFKNIQIWFINWFKDNFWRQGTGEMVLYSRLLATFVKKQVPFPEYTCGPQPSVPPVLGCVMSSSELHGSMHACGATYTLKAHIHTHKKKLTKHVFVKSVTYVNQLCSRK